MKTFRGTPGDPPKVTVEVEGRIAILPIDRKGILSPDRKFAWGDGSIGAADLSRAIIEDVIGDERETERLMMRFKHRVVATWRADEPWMITDAEVRSVIEDIRRVERETAQIRAMVAREPPPVAMEGGGGIGWKSAPDIVPNKLPKDAVDQRLANLEKVGLVPGRAYDELGILSVPCMVPPDSPFSVENIKKAKAKEA